jgi:hypothetical protein
MKKNAANTHTNVLCFRHEGAKDDMKSRFIFIFLVNLPRVFECPQNNCYYIL